MNVLRTNLTASACQQHPFKWVTTDTGTLIHESDAHSLCMTFPRIGFVRADADTTRSKAYGNYSRPVHRDEHTARSDLSPLWKSLLSDLESARYRSFIANLLGHETPAFDLEIRFVRHGPADFIGAHTDREDKQFSHIFYFNSNWREEWGGQLEILERDMSVAKRVFPGFGNSVLFERSDQSWHQVAKVSTDATSSRCSLLVHGLREPS